MTFGKAVILFFALAMLVLAFLGRESRISLIAAGGIGVIALILFIVSLKVTNPRWCYIGTVFLALAAAGRPIGTLAQGESLGFYPSGIILTVSLLTIIALMGAHFAARSKRSHDTPAV